MDEDGELLPEHRARLREEAELRANARMQADLPAKSEKDGTFVDWELVEL